MTLQPLRPSASSVACLLARSTVAELLGLDGPLHLVRPRRIMTRFPLMIRIRLLDPLTLIRTRIPPPIITRLQPRSSLKRTAPPPTRRRLGSREPLRTAAVERTARPQIRRRLDVEHLVVFPPLRRRPPHAEVERGRQQRGHEARDGEGGEGLVEAADHDARVVVPGCGRAAVAEGPAEVPGQQGQAEDPEDEEEEVGGEVVFWG